MTCAECNGNGQVQRVRQSLLGQMVTTSPCPRCGGLGEVVVTPCPTCRGEGRVTAEHTYQVDVPAGVDSGSTLRLSGRGAAGPRGGANGDLYVHLRVQPHDRYLRDGDDLVTVISVSIAQAALGTTVKLPTLDGDEEIAVPAGSQPGKQFVLRQRGVPRLQSRGRGTCVPNSSSRYRPSSPTRRRNCSASWPNFAARRSAPRTRACSRASGRRSSRRPPWTRRYAAPPAHVLVADVESPQLDADASHHLARVLRLRRGQPVTVTDGAGRWRSTVFGGDGVEATGDVVTVTVLTLPLTVAVAPPKGDRLEWLVAKCTEVGIDRLVVLEAEHSVVRWSGERLERQLDRFRRIAVEASMQCA